MLQEKIAPSALGRLIAAAPEAWSGYIHHDFVVGLGQGTLAADSFRHYLIQDYLFLKHFVRAYALMAFKADDIRDMQSALATMNALLNHEMPLHLEYCRIWGLAAKDIVQQPESAATTAYTRFVIDTGVAGDVLDLQAALIPCVVGYAVIGQNISRHPPVPGNDYQSWIDTYAGAAYQDVACAAIDQFDSLMQRRGGDARWSQLVAIFRRACDLERDFWTMGLGKLW